MDLVHKARAQVGRELNAQDRSANHVALGVALCVALAGGTAVLAARQAARAQTVDDGSAPGSDARAMLTALLPAVFSMTSLSALRVWNAPDSRARVEALSLWGLSQALNAALVWLSPRRQSAQIAAVLSAAGLTALYARAARKVDARAATLVTPYAGGAAFLGALAARPRPAAPVEPTLH